MLLTSCTYPAPLPELECKQVTVIRVFGGHVEPDFMDVECEGKLYRVEGPFVPHTYYQPGEIILAFLPKK